MKNTFLDVFNKYFEYELRIGRYKTYQIFPDGLDKSISRLMIVARFCVFFAIVVTIGTGGRVFHSIILILCLLWLQMCSYLNFIMFLLNGDDRNENE